ncbi:MAG TPA: FtsX-like permease family protein [Bryobacteraceae bacterium]|nr:FtsX-like permease family protein [Bryobacteraceae bacterium]
MTDITLQSTLIDNTLMQDKALALLSAFFSTVAIVLVIVGLYGVLSYGVTQRTREIGIRLALGARPLRVVGLVVSQIGLLTLIGSMIGLAGALSGSKYFTAYFTTLLYEVKPADVRNLVAPPTGLIVAAAIAGLVPALRAMRVSPTTALRYK